MDPLVRLTASLALCLCLLAGCATVRGRSATALAPGTPGAQASTGTSDDTARAAGTLDFGGEEVVASAPEEWLPWPSDEAAWAAIDALPLEALPEGDEALEVEDEPAADNPEEPVIPASAKRKSSRSAKLRASLVRMVTRWVGLSTLKRVSSRVPDDCSGLVRLAYQRVGLDPLGDRGRPGDNAVTTIWRRAHWLRALKRSHPRPGDLVFFRDTYDRNGDGRRNDGLTHIGVVERVHADGSITFVHRSGQGVTRGHLDLRRRSAHTDERGHVLNDYVRRQDRTDGPRLAGELFAGFASATAFGMSRPAARRSARR